ncbi:hypothetical protein, partial [Pseudomonas brassicacearum]|uniref:hypothetical protein n=1 Tax=Pseudomonas brassicacearum TaxID=930166 RepID=UPI001C1166FB
SANQLLKTCTHNFYIFYDGFSVNWRPEFYETQFNYFAQNPRIKQTFTIALFYYNCNLPYQSKAACALLGGFMIAPPLEISKALSRREAEPNPRR